MGTKKWRKPEIAEVRLDIDTILAVGCKTSGRTTSGTRTCATNRTICTYTCRTLGAS